MRGDGRSGDHEAGCAVHGGEQGGDVTDFKASFEGDVVGPGGNVGARVEFAAARVDVGPQVELDPAVMSRIVATRLGRGEDERLRTDPLYLRRPDIHGQSAARL